MIVTSKDHDARLWDWARARVLVEYPNTKNVRAEFSPDGRWIVLAGKTRLEAVRCYARAPLDDLERRGARCCLRRDQRFLSNFTQSRLLAATPITRFGRRSRSFHLSRRLPLSACAVTLT